ncbi:unnamed protein product [Rotaria sp. Silwood1]|nr:unnamed protein product [Rotaria sp. Silwood1]CAF1682043.1 unnamed protein product [Rotaria sp. Silwood1]
MSAAYVRSSTDALSDPSHKFESMDSSSKWSDQKKEASLTLAKIRNRIQSLAKSINKPGIHSVCYMFAAGFEYTGRGDAARCKDCGLEVSNWTLDMKPFIIHSKRQPDCPFVCSMVRVSLSNMSVSSSSSTTDVRKRSISNEQENPSKRQKIEPMDSESSSHTLLETDLLQQVRRRTFSHWPHRTIPSSALMIKAGFFNSNVGDQVICIYCNLICQQWTPDTDDPCEVHKTLSPNCIYVKAKLIQPETSMKVASNSLSFASNNLDPFRSNDIILPTLCNPAYLEESERLASFSTWPNEDLLSIDDFVRAGFFYTGTTTIVTCFYCNGSLQSLGPNDNPMTEHARWFPHCAYARQLCNDDLYQCVRTDDIKESTDISGTLSTDLTTNSRQLLISDESTLSRLVAARLDLPVSQRLLRQNFDVSIIKRCWEDQLRIKNDDFVSDCDLYIAYLILQKQNEHIVIPSIKMKQVREQNKTHMLEQISLMPNAVRISSNSTHAEMNISFQSLRHESTSSPSSIISISRPSTTGKEYETPTTEQPSNAHHENQPTNAAPSDPCVVCQREEKRLVCIPCGHLTTCIPCGHLLSLCPICRREIEVFVRILN